MLANLMQIEIDKINTESAFFIQELAKSTHDFASIAKDIINHSRVSVSDGVKLIQSNDIFVLGHMANFVRQRKSYEVALEKGFSADIARQRMHQVWWNTNLHLNPTNVCIGECDFCSFAKLPNEEGAYTMDVTECVNRVVAARLEGATEVHIVGGLNPKCLIEYYSDVIRAIKKEVPEIHVKAFTAVEIDFFQQFARNSQGQKLTIEEIFKALI